MNNWNMIGESQSWVHQWEPGIFLNTIIYLVSLGGREGSYWSVEFDPVALSFHLPEGLNNFIYILNASIDIIFPSFQIAPPPQKQQQYITEHFKE